MTTQRLRYDVVTAKVPKPGTEVLSSHELPAAAADAAKAAAAARDALVEVWDHELQRVIFRARGTDWRWITH